MDGTTKAVRSCGERLEEIQEYLERLVDLLGSQKSPERQNQAIRGLKEAMEKMEATSHAEKYEEQLERIKRNLERLEHHMEPSREENNALTATEEGARREKQGEGQAEGQEKKEDREDEENQGEMVYEDLEYILFQESMDEVLMGSGKIIKATALALTLLGLGGALCLCCKALSDKE